MIPPTSLLGRNKWFSSPVGDYLDTCTENSPRSWLSARQPYRYDEVFIEWLGFSPNDGIFGRD
jgi:hypothetical protein